MKSAKKTVAKEAAMSEAKTTTSPVDALDTNNSYSHIFVEAQKDYQIYLKQLEDIDANIKFLEKLKQKIIADNIKLVNLVNFSKQFEVREVVEKALRDNGPLILDDIFEEVSSTLNVKVPPPHVLDQIKEVLRGPDFFEDEEGYHKLEE